MSEQPDVNSIKTNNKKSRPLLCKNFLMQRRGVKY
ncbi:hypothetical protein MPF_2081 [Methanohalophilus portucalensis FDF-1]|uniref:Uncharacterized protein n=1 Tax=Methanohalophilus portucalensis FDF-1 TaxID=523843 RepID=A0A1L9C1W0_9EURY|nr:hypothetical protein MPF_2081 [Methanohalophilus portucalensis FDF-1]